jgi:DNA-binding MarR family transcriptional regulator
MLAYLSEGTSAASVLAGNLAVSKPSLTALADGLVTRGLVERRPAAGDRRRVDHVLTAHGEAALTAADAAVQARLDGLLHHLPRGARRRAAEGLALWLTALDAARTERLAHR